jgi:hypothetical protein
MGRHSAPSAPHLRRAAGVTALVLASGAVSTGAAYAGDYSAPNATAVTTCAAVTGDAVVAAPVCVAPNDTADAATDASSLVTATLANLLGR